jgi:hypothetical protein
MFATIRDLFAELARLTKSVRTTADLVDATNSKLAERLGFEEPAPLALEVNGRAKAVSKKA